MQETRFDPWVGKLPWRRAWQLAPVFLPGESPWIEEAGRLQSMGSQRVRHDGATKHSTQATDIHEDRSHSKPRHVNVSGTCRDVRSELQQGVAISWEAGNLPSFESLSPNPHFHKNSWGARGGLIQELRGKAIL